MTYYDTQLVSSLRALTVGNWIVLKFFFTNLLKPFLNLPKEFYDDSALLETAKKNKGCSFEVSVNRRYVDTYNQEMASLQAKIRSLWAGPAVDYKTTKQLMFWIVRFATVAAAWYTGSIKLTLLVSLLQFVCLPYSLSIALAYGLETILWGYVHHIVVYPFITHIVQELVPTEYQIFVTITPRFVGMFLLADQLLCALACVWTPKGKPVPVSPRRLNESIFYGFLNCKTYYLILLPLCFGVSMPVLPWVLDATFGISKLISGQTMKYITIFFYNIHRLGHLPYVYSDSHRFHHHLHDSTSFDAHVFGSGATEEWLLLVVDIILTHWIGTPGCFNPHLLNLSWVDKFELHTRIESDLEFDNRNLHTDHHTYHTKNFGTTYPYEMVFGTTPTEMGNIGNWEGYKVEKIVDKTTIRMKFSPLKDIADKTQ